MAGDIAVDFNALCVVVRPARAGCSAAWNAALAAYPNADAYVLGSDDAVFLPGWLEAALTKLDEIGRSGLVGLRSKKEGIQTLSAFYMMTRDFILKHHGGVAAIPHYTSWYVDAEACGRAQLAGCYTKTSTVVVRHDWYGPDGDETYRLAQDRREANKAIYEARRAAGFPDDFEPIITHLHRTQVQVESRRHEQVVSTPQAE